MWPFFIVMIILLISPSLAMYLQIIRIPNFRPQILPTYKSNGSYNVLKVLSKQTFPSHDIELPRNSVFFWYCCEMRNFIKVQCHHKKNSFLSRLSERCKGH